MFLNLYDYITNLKNLKVKAYLINCLLSVTIRRHKNWIQISFVRLGTLNEEKLGQTTSKQRRRKTIFLIQRQETLFLKFSGEYFFTLGDRKFWTNACEHREEIGETCDDVFSVSVSPCSGEKSVSASASVSARRLRPFSRRCCRGRGCCWCFCCAQTLKRKIWVFNRNLSSSWLYWRSGRAIA